MSSQSGCLAKLPAIDLQDLLQAAARITSPEQARDTFVFNPEDCAVLSGGRFPLLVSTDFGPLVGVDLRRAGRIAALHAMSDVFACGGIPMWAVTNLIVDCSKSIDNTEMVLGGILDTCREEGTQLVGGHTSLGQEAMAGLTVIGTLRGGTVLRKGGSIPGDQLLLSKPVGPGLILRAYKLGLIGDTQLEEAMEVMCCSNGLASKLAVDVGVHAATDITGFGLLGHLAEMLGHELGAVIDVSSVPILEAATSLIDKLGNTRWIQENLDYVRDHNQVILGSEPSIPAFLLDPQTNGGLLVAANESATRTLSSQGFFRIGEVTNTKTIELCYQ